MNRYPQVGETVVLRRYPQPEFNGLTFKRIGSGPGDLIRCMVVRTPFKPVEGYSSNYFIGQTFECTLDLHYWDLAPKEGFRDWARKHP